jgi:transcriptional regulator with XRE-family HTH domain
MTAMRRVDVITDASSFGDRLVYVLHHRGMTQDQAAVALGVHRTAVCHYTGGARVPQVAMVRRICVVLRVSADFLLCLTNVMWDPLPGSNQTWSMVDYKKMFMNEEIKL